MNRRLTILLAGVVMAVSMVAVAGAASGGNPPTFPFPAPNEAARPPRGTNAGAYWVGGPGVTA